MVTTAKAYKAVFKEMWKLQQTEGSTTLEIGEALKSVVEVDCKGLSERFTEMMQSAVLMEYLEYCKAVEEAAQRRLEGLEKARQVKAANRAAKDNVTVQQEQQQQDATAGKNVEVSEELVSIGMALAMALQMAQQKKAV